MQEKIKKLLITPDAKIKDAMKQMDTTAEKLLLVVDPDDSFLGTLSDGDIRRHILNYGNLNLKIEKSYNRDPIYLKEGEGEKKARKLMLENKILSIPVINSSHKIVGLIVWNVVFNGKRFEYKIIKDVPVVIMAGGKGKRLDPVTRILPKPLIPIGEKPILEIIMDKFSQFGISDFHLSVNYKGEMIKAYLDYAGLPYNFEYIWEKNFLGTAGSLKYLPKNFPSPFIVSNCDIILDADYSDLVKFHKENKNDITVVGSVQHHKIPYGVIEAENGCIKTITEKPEWDLTVNTGVYVMQRNILDCFPRGSVFDTTDLIERLIQLKKRIGLYPVSENSYIDIGQWEKYREAVQNFSHLT